jgi:hypothetical protein
VEVGARVQTVFSVHNLPSIPDCPGCVVLIHEQPACGDLTARLTHGAKTSSDDPRSSSPLREYFRCELPARSISRNHRLQI